MKRYGGFLKRPEILETVYSVEDPDDAETVERKGSSKVKA